jgi:hypothetical protein
MANVKTLRAADIQIYINGRLFGVAVGLRWQGDDGRHAIYGIDQYTPFELAPGQSMIKGTVDCLRLRRDGGLEGRGVNAPESKLMLEKYFSLAVVDRSTDTVILAIESAAMGNQSWQATAKGDMSGSFTFEGLGWTSESET